PGDDRRLPAEERRRGEASTTTGRVGKRMVAARRQPASQVGHAERLVRRVGADGDGGAPRRVEPCRKPPWYEVRMPGGVRGGRREASPYSIRVGVAAAREINEIPAARQSTDESRVRAARMSQPGRSRLARKVSSTGTTISGASSWM